MEETNGTTIERNIQNMITYGHLLAALYELTPEQLKLPATVEVFVGLNQAHCFFCIQDTVLSCEINDKVLRAEALTALDENHPLLLTTKEN